MLLKGSQRAGSLKPFASRSCTSKTVSLSSLVPPFLYLRFWQPFHDSTPGQTCTQAEDTLMPVILVDAPSFLYLCFWQPSHDSTPGQTCTQAEDTLMPVILVDAPPRASVTVRARSRWSFFMCQHSLTVLPRVNPGY